jgi:beta-N-acetylhexosaminidase
VYGKVLKILNYKQALGLDNFKNIDENNVEEDLNNTSAKYVNFRLIEQQMCLVKDERLMLPLHPKDDKEILSIAIGDGSKVNFQRDLERLNPKVSSTYISKNATTEQFNRMFNKISGYDIVIVSLHNMSKYPPNYGITSQVASFVNKLSKNKNYVLVDFGNPYNLVKFHNQKTVLLAFDDFKENHLKAAEAIFGVIGVNGTLPISVGTEYKATMGVTTYPISELNTAEPEVVGMSSSKLAQIDEIANNAIALGAMPGCQILVAKDGRVVYDKSFGRHTFSSPTNVCNNDLYDLASITKVAATTISIMKLYEENELSIDDKMIKYLPELAGTNKSHMTIRMVLEHKAGLKDWIPFYHETIKDQVVYDSIYSTTKTGKHTINVGNDLYMLNDYKAYMMQTIYDSELSAEGKYKYSDLGMILMKVLIERVTGRDFDDYVNSTFYKPMGLTRITFLPLNKFDKGEIIPTSIDADMRKGLLQGCVHDPAAAMLGGISGHAGLFGNAESLASLMQMLLNGGEYNNVRYLKQSTIDLFTIQQASDSRRGIGWDKPEMNRSRGNPASDYASAKCFGHSGFTGTIIWADPEYDLVYVFLSNRVYPTQANRKLISQSVRTNIQDVIYESFLHP